ncbi:MAG: hypothetical protein MJZ05_05665 [Fibrobacter sp.]|nr:hypothetical protein [Fibrobacter sp.]
MAGISIWTIIGVIILLVALVVLFFPFLFRIEFRADLYGCNGRVYLFKKLLCEGKKSFKGDSDKKPDDDLDDADFAPVYVPPKKKKPVEKIEEKEVVSSAPKAPVEKLAAPIENSEPSKSAEKIAALKAAEEKPLEPAPETPSAEPVQETVSDAVPAAPSLDDSDKPDAGVSPKEKPKLTETEFWTILLTPEFDETAFWAVRKLLASILKLFRVKFQDCFVEGIRGDYVTMGYGAALNGILKSFPFVGAWDLRMDWTRDHELCAQGKIFASINLFRILGVIVTVLFFGAILGFKFWRRRARVLKTHELPELGWIRSKIVKMLAEE